MDKYPPFLDTSFFSLNQDHYEFAVCREREKAEQELDDEEARALFAAWVDDRIFNGQEDDPTAPKELPE